MVMILIIFINNKNNKKVQIISILDSAAKSMKVIVEVIF